MDDMLLKNEKEDLSSRKCQLEGKPEARQIKAGGFSGYKKGRPGPFPFVGKHFVDIEADLFWDFLKSETTKFKLPHTNGDQFSDTFLVPVCLSRKILY